MVSRLLSRLMPWMVALLTGLVLFVFVEWHYALRNIRRDGLQRVSELQKSNEAKRAAVEKMEAEDQIAFEKSKAELERLSK